MSKFPTELDDDITLPRADDNVTEIRADIINAIRHAVFNIQAEIGLGARGSRSSLADRINECFEQDGKIKNSYVQSIVAAMGSIGNNQIKNNAAIAESKLQLDYPTSQLNSSLLLVNEKVEQSLNFISSEGSKLAPHLSGVDPSFAHKLNEIILGPQNEIKNRKQVLRGTPLAPSSPRNAYSTIKDLNDDFVSHQLSTGQDSDGNFAHTAAGIGIKTDKFSYIDKGANDLQSLAEFIDQNSLSLLGTRTQTLYQNGIPRTSRSFPINSSLVENYQAYASIDGYTSAIFGSVDSLGKISAKVNGGQLIVPPTTASTQLSLDAPSDKDDVIKFLPSGKNNYAFYKQFNSVLPGDNLTINYKDGNESNSTITSFVVREVKAVFDTNNPLYEVRVNGKNIFKTSNAVAIISKPYFNTNKYGVLAIAPVASRAESKPGLIIGDPRSAQVLGTNFNPSQLGPQNYNLYLTFYPTSNPDASQGNRLSGPIQIKAIDVTGNRGLTPGAYTLEHIVEQTNIAFQAPGYNLRFIAFSHNGEFGVMLADPYNGASFSIIAGVLGADGNYDGSNSSTSYPDNVIDVSKGIDPLGFGPLNADVAGPPYAASYGNSGSVSKPVKIFTPLRRNNFYTNGGEKEKLSQKFLQQEEDQNGDGFWEATIVQKNIIPTGRVEVTYRINKLLTNVDLRPGKTIVVQPYAENIGLVQDFGRFLIESVKYDSINLFTEITVYDAVHNAGQSPYPISNTDTFVKIYFSSDSVAFSDNSEFDVNYTSIPSPIYNRHFEILSDESGSIFSHERARFVSSNTRNDLESGTNIKKINIVRVSPKLIGYDFKDSVPSAQGVPASSLRKITLKVTSTDITSGKFEGYLCRYDGQSELNKGLPTTAKFGEVVRFYDESNINYIDFCFSLKDIAQFTNEYLNIQIFQTLSLSQELMLIGTVQLDGNRKISYLRDERQFGNVSEKQLSNSAINFIESGDRLLHENGIISGLDKIGQQSNAITLAGGTCFINGKVVQINTSSVFVPNIKDDSNNNIDWFLCADQTSKLTLVPKTTSDSIVTVSASDYGVPTKVYSSTFNNLLRNRKDLLALYTLSYDSATPANLTTKDIRLFALKQSGLNKIVVSSESSGGNFKSIDSAIDYIKLFGLYEREIYLKSSSIKDYFYLTGYPISFTGIGEKSKLTLNGNTSITGVSAIDVVRFKNCSIEFNSNANLDKVEFENCYLTFNNSAGITNTKFKNCSVFLNSKITFNNNVSLENSEVTASATCTMGIELSSNTKINSCTFYYSYSNDAASKLNFDNGLLYKLVQNNSTIENVSVENNTFNSATSKDNYYPFISICLESIGSNVSGVKSLTIKNNKFLSNKVDSSYRAVVSIYSVGNGIKQSTIMNSEISGNVCNSNQSIIVTDNSSTKKLPLFSSNFAIKNNTCGTIGILAGTSPENASGSIDVRGNTVKLISNLDYTATSKMIYGDGYLPTCFMSIQDNIVNWIDIQTNNSNSNKETCIISKNKIFAGNPQVLSNIATNIFNIALSYKASNVSANTSLSIISDNSIYSENSYTYNTAIYCEGYANIIGNSISGCVKNSSNTNYPIVQIASGSVLFTNNTINRSGLEVDCFIKGPGTSSALKSKIINNVLIGADSTYTTNKDTPSSSPNIWYDTNFSW